MDSTNNNPNPNPSANLSFKGVNHSIFLDFLYGTASGLIGKGIFYPLENFQKQVSERADYKAFKRREAYFSGTPKVFQEGGLLGLFKGFFPTVAKYSVYLGSDLAIFYQIKYSMYPKETINRRDIALKANILCGVLASLFSYTLFTPLLESKSFNQNPLDVKTLNTALKAGQIATLYPHWKYELPYALLSRGILIGLYEAKFKKQYYLMQGRVPYFMRFLDAYALSLFSAFIAYPFRHTKERMIDAFNKNPQDPDALFREMAKKEGSKLLLKGISQIFTTQLSTAVALTVFFTILEKRKDGEL